MFLIFFSFFFPLFTLLSLFGLGTRHLAAPTYYCCHNFDSFSSGVGYGNWPCPIVLGGSMRQRKSCQRHSLFGDLFFSTTRQVHSSSMATSKRGLDTRVRDELKRKNGKERREFGRPNSAYTLSCILAHTPLVVRRWGCTLLFRLDYVYERRKQ